MALGTFSKSIIDGTSNRSMEEEAEDYLAELVDRSMLQLVDRNASGRMKAFRMHDVVREVTLAISRKAKFCMILDSPQSVLAISRKLFISLTKMSNLRNLRLSLSSADTSEGLNFEMLNNSPPPLLQKLELLGRLFEGKMPRMICSCAELTHVSLLISRLIEDPLPSFGQLPKLVEFSLTYEAYEGKKLHFKTGWFLNLKLLDLQGLKNLKDIVIEEGAMINLRKLVILDFEKVPSGIEFLTHLQIWLQETMQTT